MVRVYEIYKSNEFRSFKVNWIKQGGRWGGSNLQGKKKNKANTEVQNTTATQTDTSG